MPTRTWLERYQPDLDNFRLSLDWAFGPSGDCELGLELCAYSLRMWDELALLSERERWFSIAFRNAGLTTPAPVMARLWMGQMSNSAHGDRTNFVAAQSAANLFQQNQDILSAGEAFAKAGAALETLSTTGEAFPFLEKALRLLTPCGPSKPLANCLRSLAVAYYFKHDFEQARSLLERSETIARVVGDLRGIAAVQIAAAELSFAAGNTELAISDINQLLSGRHANRRQVTLAFGNLTAYLLALDRIAEARVAGLRALEEARALDWRPAVFRAVEHLALVMALTGRQEAAASLLGRCVGFYATEAASREYTELATYERLMKVVTAAVGPTRLKELMTESALWTLEQTIQQARLVADLPS